MVGVKDVIWNPYTKGYFDNPYPHLKECRESNPIHIGSQGSWTFFEHSDVSEILRSSQSEVSDLSAFFKEKENVIFGKSNQCPYLSTLHEKWPLYLNGEQHKIIRSSLGKIFNEIDFKTIIDSSMDILLSLYENKPQFNLCDFSGYYVYHILKSAFDLNSLDYEELSSFSESLALSQDVFVPRHVYLEINKKVGIGFEQIAESKLKSDIAGKRR